MKAKTTNLNENSKKEIAGAMESNASEKYSLRGRKFEGYVTKKFDKRVTIEFERVNFIRKYERYSKSRSKMHARLPENMKNEINIGDYIQIMECRPLSKIIHFVVIKKIRDSDINAQKILKNDVKEIKPKRRKDESKEEERK